MSTPLTPTQRSRIRRARLRYDKRCVDCGGQRAPYSIARCGRCLARTKGYKAPPEPCRPYAVAVQTTGVV